MSASRLRRRARSCSLWIRSHDECVVCAGAREERRCGKSVDPLGSGNHSCCAKATSEDCDEHRGSRRLVLERSAFRSQSLLVFRMNFAEAWDKKAAHDNWATLEKTRHQIGIGVATDVSPTRW